MKRKIWWPTVDISRRPGSNPSAVPARDLAQAKLVPPGSALPPLLIDRLRENCPAIDLRPCNAAPPAAPAGQSHWHRALAGLLSCRRRNAP